MSVASDAKCPSAGPIARLFELSLDMMGTASSDGYFTRLNPAWEKTLGWTIDELMAQPFVSFMHPADVEAVRLQAAELLEVGGPAVERVRNRYVTRAGGYRWIEWTSVADEDVFYFVARDITERRAAEIDRQQAANVSRAIIDSVADGLCVIDPMGKLTLINPAGLKLFGYGRTDEMIGRSAHAMLHHSHEDGTPYPSEDCPLSRVRGSGVAIRVDEDTFWCKDGSALPVAYSSAPMALSDGVGSVVAFRDISAVLAEQERLRGQLGEATWFEEVRKAMAEDRLTLYGQPIVDLVSGEIVQHELLLRMISPAGEVIAAAVFLPAAEKYGLIDVIDRWVIAQAVDLAAAGRSVAINISAESVGSVEILAHIERELARTEASPEYLTFEVTETAVMTDIQAGRRFADRLVDLGCSFALDDFGVGYGSLTYLRQLPFAYLKIDMQFVGNMTQSEPDQKLVQAIVHIARSLGQKTVAEGVEDEQTLSLLRDLGVDFAQGYYLGRPAPFPVEGEGLSAGGETSSQRIGRVLSASPPS